MKKLSNVIMRKISPLRCLLATKPSNLWERYTNLWNEKCLGFESCSEFCVIVSASNVNKSYGLLESHTHKLSSLLIKNPRQSCNQKHFPGYNEGSKTSMESRLWKFQSMLRNGSMLSSLWNILDDLRNHQDCNCEQTAF